MKLTKELIFEIFEYGVDYGQLLMEEERESEEAFDALIGVTVADRYNVASAPVQRRQLHSENWFTAKRKSQIKLLEMINKL